MAKAISVAMTLMLAPTLVSANFFFMLSDTLQIGCLETEVRTKEEAIRTIEESTTSKCTAVLDGNDDILVTCKGFSTTIYFFASDKATCERTLASMRRLIGN